MTSVLDLARARRGHFLLESGHHSRLWLDLDDLFAESQLVAPMAAALTDKLRAHDVNGVCGPLLGGAFLAQLVARDLGVQFFFTDAIGSPSDGNLFHVRYRLPPALIRRAPGRRMAVVDDVMSAGSAARGTYAELRLHGAETIVVGALLVLGGTAIDYFSRHGVAVEAVRQEPYELWLPTACPLCAAGVPVEAPANR